MHITSVFFLLSLSLSLFAQTDLPEGEYKTIFNSGLSNTWKFKRVDDFLQFMHKEKKESDQSLKALLEFKEGASQTIERQEDEIKKMKKGMDKLRLRLKKLEKENEVLKSHESRVSELETQLGVIKSTIKHKVLIEDKSDRNKND